MAVGDFHSAAKTELCHVKLTLEVGECGIFLNGIFKIHQPENAVAEPGVESEPGTVARTAVNTGAAYQGAVGSHKYQCEFLRMESGCLRAERHLADIAHERIAGQLRFTVAQCVFTARRKKKRQGKCKNDFVRFCVKFHVEFHELGNSVTKIARLCVRRAIFDATILPQPCDNFISFYQSDSLAACARFRYWVGDISKWSRKARCSVRAVPNPRRSASAPTVSVESLSSTRRASSSRHELI